MKAKGPMKVFFVGTNILVDLALVTTPTTSSLS